MVFLLCLLLPYIISQAAHYKHMQYSEGREEGDYLHFLLLLTSAFPCQSCVCACVLTASSFSGLHC